MVLFITAITVGMEEHTTFTLGWHYRWFLRVIARCSLSYCPQNRAQLSKTGAWTIFWIVVFTLDP